MDYKYRMGGRKLKDGQPNEKQLRFTREYAKDLNGTQAAIRAGYSIKSAAVIATELLRKPNIAAMVAKLCAKRGEKIELNAEWVLRNLKIVSARCLQEVKPKTTRNGVETGEFEFDSNGVCKANELIGKHLGMFKERHEITGADGGVIKMETGVIILPAKKS